MDGSEVLAPKSKRGGDYDVPDVIKKRHNSNTNWLTNPPEVRCVRAREPVTHWQVELLEEFIKPEIGQPFTLIFEVGQAEEIQRSESTR